MKKAYPSGDGMTGLLYYYYDDIPKKTECSSDLNFCGRVFSHSITDPAQYWGAKNKNDWAQVTFHGSLLYISHYSIESPANQRRAKGFIVEGIKQNGNEEVIDSVDDLEISESHAVKTRKVNNVGPFRSIRFIVTDTYFSADYYAGVWAFDVFGILSIGQLHGTCKIKYQSMKFVFWYSLLLLLIC